MRKIIFLLFCVFLFISSCTNGNKASTDNNTVSTNTNTVDTNTVDTDNNTINADNNTVEMDNNTVTVDPTKSIDVGEPWLIREGKTQVKSQGSTTYNGELKTLQGIITVNSYSNGFKIQFVGEAFWQCSGFIRVVQEASEIEIEITKKENLEQNPYGLYDSFNGYVEPSEDSDRYTVGCDFYYTPVTWVVILSRMGLDAKKTYSIVFGETLFWKDTSNNVLSSDNFTMTAL